MWAWPMKKLLQRIERLEWLVDRLQDALGWQIEVEKLDQKGNSYNVTLAFTIKLKAKVFELAYHYRDYRQTLYELLKYKVEQLWTKKPEPTTTIKPNQERQLGVPLNLTPQTKRPPSCRS